MYGAPQIVNAYGLLSKGTGPYFRIYIASLDFFRFSFILVNLYLFSSNDYFLSFSSSLFHLINLFQWVMRFSNCSDGAEELGLNISLSGITTFFISNE